MNYSQYLSIIILRISPYLVRMPENSETDND